MKKIIPIIFIITAIILERLGYLSHPQVLGIFFDIIGAYYLAQSFVTKKLEDIVCESSGNKSDKYPGSLSENLGQSLYQQTIEARTGFVILTAGFIIQGVSIEHPDWNIDKYWGAGSILLLLIGVSFIHWKLFNGAKISKKLEDKDREISKKYEG